MKTDDPDIPHAVAALVSSLLEPPDMDLRQSEYDWYMHYHTDELLATGSTAEPQDLQRYVRAAQIAAGMELDEPTTPQEAPQVPAIVQAAEAARDDQYEPSKASLTHYENFQHAHEMV